MKILHRGSQKWTMKLTCHGTGYGGGGCGALLLVEEEDLFRYERSVMGEISTHYGIRCLQCNLGSRIDVDLIPVRILRDALNEEDWKKAHERDSAVLDAS